MAAATLPFSLYRRPAPEQVAAVEKGLPTPALAALAQALGLSETDLAAHLRLPARTLSRRRASGRLSAQESERVLRFTALFERAAEVLGGHEAAARWMQAPRSALGGATPLAYAETEPGAREVEHLLGRIEHGVFS